MVKRWVLESSNLVVCLFGHEAENVSAYITSSESWQIPVSFDGGYLRIVDVEVAVGGSNELLWDSVTEENVGYSVLYIVNPGFIEG